MTTADNMKEVFGEYISVYTRAQAIADGVLVDVTEMAHEAGFKWPVAMTRAVYERYVEVPDELKGEQDASGRAWDILRMLWLAIRLGRITAECGTFTLLVRFAAVAEWQSNERAHAEGAGLRLVTLKAVSGPGDNGEPCISIMLLVED